METIIRYHAKSVRGLCAGLSVLILLGLFSPLALAQGACAGGCCIGAEIQHHPSVTLRMAAEPVSCCCGDTAVASCQRPGTLESTAAGTLLRHTEDGRPSLSALSTIRVLAPNAFGIKSNPHGILNFSLLKTPLYIQTAALLC